MTKPSKTVTSIPRFPWVIFTETANVFIPLPKTMTYVQSITGLHRFLAWAILLVFIVPLILK